jgi:hypothetical protein
VVQEDLSVSIRQLGLSDPQKSGALYTKSSVKNPASGSLA